MLRSWGPGKDRRDSLTQCCKIIYHHEPQTLCFTPGASFLHKTTTKDKGLVQLRSELAQKTLAIALKKNHSENKQRRIKCNPEFPSVGNMNQLTEPWVDQIHNQNFWFSVLITNNLSNPAVLIDINAMPLTKDSASSARNPYS
ncbi:centromere protein R [Platysternon megacephalum]|uniref:Centromere protein R n=1 Tax=Platysternon megacephalum TaxID=55544 RepID=A0A4D9EJ22_9SAUR|nr:centromere protein R [Platysternon megacephalum]